MHMYFQDIAIGSKWANNKTNTEVTVVDKLSNQDIVFRDARGRRDTRDCEDFQNTHTIKSN